MDVHIKPSTLYVFKTLKTLIKHKLLNGTFILKELHIPQEVHVILHLIIKANIYLVLNERCVHQCKRT